MYDKATLGQRLVLGEIGELLLAPVPASRAGSPRTSSAQKIGL
jgi:hypothetical protein